MMQTHVSAALEFRAPVRSPKAPAQKLPTVQDHLALVTSEARRMARRLPGHVRAEDLVGSGCMGLMAAVERFDPLRGSEFTSFARLKIRAAMLDELRELDLLPRRARASLNRLERARRGFLGSHGREPTRTELAAHARMTDKAVEELLAMGERAHAAEPLEAADSCSHDGTTTLACAEHREAVSRLSDAVHHLSDRHQRVLAAYYQGDMTFREIGQRWGVTESRICQLHAEAVKELRKAL